MNFLKPRGQIQLFSFLMLSVSIQLLTTENKQDLQVVVLKGEGAVSLYWALLALGVWLVVVEGHLQQQAVKESTQTYLSHNPFLPGNP